MAVQVVLVAGVVEVAERNKIRANKKSMFLDFTIKLAGHQVAFISLI